MSHSCNWLRVKGWHKAIRKRRLDRELAPGEDFYDNLHQYSKNKIHCSCSLCSCKTKNKGKRRHLHGNYAPSYNWCVRDLRSIDSAREQIKNFDNECLNY